PLARQPGSRVGRRTLRRRPSRQRHRRPLSRSAEMTRYRTLVLIVLVAVANGLFFIWYQKPDWNTEWPDQTGYRQLAQSLATTGKFTKAPDAPQFVPEVIRTPVYPMFVATIYKVAGTGQLPVALAQTALFAAICVLVYATARRVADERVATL